MFCLETIIKRNELAQQQQHAARLANPPRALEDLPHAGWAVTPGYQGIPGLIHVSHPDVPHYQVLVDVSNPLDDYELVDFHRHFQGPNFVRQQVERIASQYRRIVTADPGSPTAHAPTCVRC